MCVCEKLSGKDKLLSVIILIWLDLEGIKILTVDVLTARRKKVVLVY